MHRGRGPLPALLALPVLPAAALAGWAWVSYRQNGGDWHDTVLMLAAGAAAYVVGLAASSQRAVIGPLLAAGIGASFFLVDGAFSGHPLAPPLGYENANGALVTQAAVAAGLAVASTKEWGREVALTGVAAVGVLSLAVGSAAGVATFAVVALAVAVAAVGYAPRQPQLGGWFLVLSVPPLITILVATRPWLPGLDHVSSWVTQRRVDLWQDAVSLTRQHPWSGWGPGQFSVESATAAADADTRAAHSALLEVAAELGLVGVAIAVAAIGTGVLLIRLGAENAPEAALVGAAGWTALWIHATVDYVVDFPAVFIVATFLLGMSGRSVYRSRRRPVRRST